ncbi:hypothetical protein QJS10_CPB20g01140 [Acorus calamus]|uniref:Uncharacterized protein n=1 Tax=Acorus calamus TaxID=4465 RepID=A0AAV9CDM3_ACOCL|nr:hypothetical protein QJS10_CPB20g01140 [Acorus calamus]
MGDLITGSARNSNLKKSFKLSIRCLYGACSIEEFNKAFPTFGPAERERLRRLFLQVMASLHDSIEEEFESICQETRVGSALANLEQLVEEQNLDILPADKTKLQDIKDKLLREKKEEIQFLKGQLQEVVEQNTSMKSRIEGLKTQDFPATTNAVKKLKRCNTDVYDSLCH